MSARNRSRRANLSTIPITVTGAGPSHDLRLAIFSDTALPQVNGVARTLDRLADAVRDRGGSVRIFTTTDPATSDTSDPAGGDAVRYPSRPFWAYPQLRMALPSTRDAAAALQAWRPTLVHVATPFGVGLAGRRAARHLGLPLVTSYHTSLSAYAKFYRLGALATPGWSFLRWFHNGGARTFCPTRSIQRELLGRGFRDTRVWGRGVDMARFSPRWRSDSMRRRLGAEGDRLVVAYVGRLAAEKGLDVALEAMRRMDATRPGRWVFAFAGDGPYADRCRATAPAGSIFLGQLEGEELSAFYASADLFVFPSVTDTFGNVLLEAMASGLPIVGADAQATLEVLEPGGGVTFPAGDGAALAALLLELSDDAPRRRSLAAAALENARGRDWASVFDLLMADYMEVIEQHASRGRARRKHAASVGMAERPGA